jgi:hypothetical protein
MMSMEFPVALLIVVLIDRRGLQDLEARHRVCGGQHGVALQRAQPEDPRLSDQHPESHTHDLLLAFLHQVVDPAAAQPVFSLMFH